MKRALQQIDDINLLIDSVYKSNYSTFKRDRKKGAKRKIKELREYCNYKGLDFNELKKDIKRLP